MPIQLSEFLSLLITPLFLIASLFVKHQTYNTELPIAPARVQTHLSNKRNVVLYLDKELVAKSREIGFNLSKTFENHLKQLLTQFSQINSSNTNGNNRIFGDWWAGPDLNRRPLARKAPELTSKSESELLERFRDFQIVDLRRSKRTAYEKVWFIKRLLRVVEKELTAISREDLREYLKTFESYSVSHYKNALRALKVFFRDFLDLPEVVASFKFPHQVFKPKQIVRDLGYRLHLAVDVKSEMPVAMTVASANENEKKHSMQLFERASCHVKPREAAG